jgi:hypothetical protein
MGLGAIRHVSVRVPWHDNGWNGRVCLDPKGFSACLALRRTALNRDDDYEACNADTCFSDLEKKPPCLAERGAFLSPRPQLYSSVMPYSRSSPMHGHIREAHINVPSYGGTLTPFRWVHQDFAFEIAAQHGLEASLSREPKEGEVPDFVLKSDWVQSADNQIALLDGFAADLTPEHSLVFFYAKQTPLSDAAGRQIVAVAKLKSLGKIQEYPYEGGAVGSRIRSAVWERTFQHSLEPDEMNEGVWNGGVVLPYHEILARSAEAGFDPADYLAEVPADSTDQFLYASEQVTHGGGISALLSVRSALERTKEILQGPWERYIGWIDTELSSLWKMHGLAPGLGSALSLIGGKFNGTLFAHALASELDDDKDPWPVIEAIFAGEREPPANAPAITRTQKMRFADTIETDPQRYAFLKLLSRFELTKDQAAAIDDVTSDPTEILKNPYRLYEATRRTEKAIGLTTVDRTLFPEESGVRGDIFPKEMEVDLQDSEDPSRLRAIIIDALERASLEGHTLLSVKQLALRLQGAPLAQAIKLDDQIVRLCRKEFEPELYVFEHGDDWFLQLNRYRDAGEIIRSHVIARLKHIAPSQIDWAPLLEEEFKTVAEGDEDEAAARKEKLTALQTLESHTLAILTGSAGTGKTTLLKLLLKQESVVGRDVLLLAPTGKARVRLGNQTGMTSRAQTLAQFLWAKGRYDPSTAEYLFDASGDTEAVSTCVIDECSMLTEDQLAALLSALPVSARIILVGDPQQLPPIGAGRPFVDIIEELKKEHGGAGLAELQVSRRQGQNDEPVPALSLPDVQLANLFSGRPLEPGEDEIVANLASPKDSERLRFISWETPKDLRQKILDVLSSELGAANGDLAAAIDVTLGAEPSGEYRYFNVGAGKKAEKWQVLSAHRNQSSGSAEINRLIKSQARANWLELAMTKRSGWRIVKPRGSDLITYGDKVICLRNHKHKSWSPDEGAVQGYLANGEIGMVVGESASDRKPFRTKVEFASQVGKTFDFIDSDFSEEKSPALELAYAVTVHKAQGSEFDCVFLVLPANSRLLTREMLYTALTRQKDRVWVLHEGPFNHYLKLSSDFYSETARRTTNLFGAPQVSLIELAEGGKRKEWLSENLIHRTQRGDLVRSKSEVIIADILNEYEKAGKLRYSYEKPVEGPNGDYRLPDFTVETEDGVWFWEHCGMLGLPEYARRWESKKRWYADELGVKEWSATSPDGKLIVSEDALNGGIDSAHIRANAEALFGGTN